MAFPVVGDRLHTLEKELIINAGPAKVEIALLEGKRLVEVHNQKTSDNFTVGDVFLGRVRKLMPGLNAAFVDIGYKKDAFLHYTDLSPKLKSVVKFTRGATSGGMQTHLLDNFRIQPDIVKGGKITEVLEGKGPILVQILKEPISTKGPRLTCEFALPGRYMVLVPFSDTVNVSKKIGDKEERTRLKRLTESIKPERFGVIIRTAAVGKGVADLHEEMTRLLGKWEQIYKQMHNAKAPKKLLSELDKTSSILRDLLNDDFNRVVVNDADLAASIKSYLGEIAPDKVKIVQSYTQPKPIFDRYGVTRQIKQAFGKTATMSSGAYLVIEHTEALHVIDVNSGPNSGSKSQEDNVLTVNLESVAEVARQLRLRDIGGIIIIDFIDMRKAEHRKQVYEAMVKAMSKDRARHTILPLSKFGLMQITRERTRPQVNITTSEKCSVCDGTGKVNATILIADNIVRDLEFILSTQSPKNLTIRLHPFLHAYFSKGFPSKRLKWSWKHKRNIKIFEDNDYQLTEYRFFDGEDEIRLV